MVVKFRQTSSPLDFAKEALKSRTGKIAKGGASFLLGPAVLLTGLVVGIFTKAVAEISNAALSTWVKSFNTGMTQLFSNNPFLSWLSGTSDSIMKGSWSFATHFYSSGLTSMATQFEEWANHDGFGSTGVSGEKNDPRDNEAIAADRKEKAAKRLQEERQKFRDSLAEFKKKDPVEASKAMQDLERWINRGQEIEKEVSGLPAPLTKDQAEELMKKTSKYFTDFNLALETNSSLKALFDLSNQASIEAFARLQEQNVGREDQVSAQDFSEMLFKVAQESGLKLPDSLVKHPRGKEFQTKAPQQVAKP
jgi:hypothetical protein